MQYVTVFCVVFMVIGLRAFQQKVVAANHYPGMGIVAAMIYSGEGTAILLISRGSWVDVICGATGAGLGVMLAVYCFNTYFSKTFLKKVKPEEG